MYEKFVLRVSTMNCMVLPPFSVGGCIVYTQKTQPSRNKGRSSSGSFIDIPHWWDLMRPKLVRGLDVFEQLTGKLATILAFIAVQFYCRLNHKALDIFDFPWEIFFCHLVANPSLFWMKQVSQWYFLFIWYRQKPSKEHSNALFACLSEDSELLFFESWNAITTINGRVVDRLTSVISMYIYIVY